jgi:cell division protein FtsZ
MPGTPSPEAVARLRAAVHNAPAHAEADAVAAPEANKPRFGINSLINRMTGHHAETAQDAPRPQPKVQAASHDDEPAADPEHERVEIPAFLRRQAN